MPVAHSLVAFNSSNLIPNTTYYKETGSITYAQSGVAVQVNSDNEKVTTIYDYDDKVPIATIVNANHNQVAYSSFETSNSGGWER